MYKWDNLPNGIAKRFIEKNLFYNGRLAFFKDSELGFIVTKCTPSEKLNIYEEPIAYTCYGVGFSKNVSSDDLIVIRNNIIELPTFNIVKMYIDKIADITRVIDTNIFQQKIPKIVTCTESQRLTIKNLMTKVEGNEPYILGNKGLDLDGINVFDTSAPFISDKLYDIKKRLWTELLETLGINNANTDKKERLIQDEVNSNNQLLKLQNETFLMTRKFAVDEINQKFNLNLEVELREDLYQDGGVENE